MMNTIPPCYAFGCGDTGQLGLGSGVETNESKPTACVGLENVDITQLSCGGKHTALLTASDQIYTFGNNDFGQLGRSRRIGQAHHVEALDSQKIIQVSCGQSHTMALTHERNVYCWGRNNHFQLCAQEPEFSVKPHLLKPLTAQNIVKISCGASHNIVLADNSVAWSWGSGSHGENGRGVKGRTESPLPIKGLDSVPIIDALAGDSFSLVLTVAGRVYSWGLGLSGQLGHNDTKERIAPQLIEGLRTKMVTNIACGKFHCVALTSSGEVYVWGQLKPNELVLVPTLLPFSKTHHVVAIGCGDTHTLLVTAHQENSAYQEEVYTFGSNSYGKLGVGSLSTQLITEPTKCFSVSNSYCFVDAGSDFSIIFHSPNVKRRKTPLVHYATPQIIKQLCAEYNSGHTGLQALKTFLEKSFSWPTTMNASFIDEKAVNSCDPTSSGLDLHQVRESFDALLQLQEPTILDILNKSFSRCLSKHNSQLTTNPETMRVFLIMLESPTLVHVTRLNLPLLERLVNSLNAIPEAMKLILHDWWANYRSEYFARIVQIFNGFITYLAINSVDDRLVFATIKIVSVLYKLNAAHSIIPYENFYLDDQITLSPKLDLEAEYFRWRSAPTGPVFSYLNYPYFLSPEAKARIMEIDATQQKLRSSLGAPFSPFLVLKIRRDHLVQDALTQLSQEPRENLKKHAVIQFIGEEGVDQGGVRKEFFQLVVEELFHSKDLFIKDEETGDSWFNHESTEYKLFHFMGLVIGLAIYNSTLLDIRLPLVVWKKLLESCPGISYTDRHQYVPDLHDLKATFPIIGKNLEYLLHYEGDVLEDFDEIFQVAYQVKGKTFLHDLIPNGSQISVTNENRLQYVQQYGEFLLHKNIEKQFNPFKEGFLTVCGGPVLSLFRAEELEKALVGANQEIDTITLQQVTEYEGFSKNDQIIIDFWNIVHSWSQENKKKMLFFTTGSDRLPIGGMKKMKFKIQRNGPDSERLPTASTCYNTLLLPQYSTKPKLLAKLELMIQNWKGFGLQ